MCPWNGNIPQPTDQLNNSQPQLLQNFQAIETLISVNHFDFGTANQGKHTQVTLPENVAPINTAIDQANIYSQLSTLTNTTELFWQRENNGERIEWTASSATLPGWMRLPSGMLIKWGRSNSTGTGFAVVFPVAATIPVFTTALFVMVTTDSNGSVACSSVPGSLTPLQFVVNTYSVSTGLATASGVFWLVIGT